ncbi:MAG TPA: hypothetical protein VEM96_03435 [Pyrinomonadaceae bacterium]|nr:hypothetical protein [Pyrinomonadaceae bacterium]
MFETLKTAFLEYLEQVALRLRPTGGGAGRLYVLRNPVVELNTIVETLEQSESFKRLMEGTQHEFPPKGVGIVNYWQYDIQHFFRRTGSYEDIYGGQAINLDDLFQGYLAALQRETVQVRCLAPINAVDFGMIPLDLGEFSIRKFSKAELDLIFENERRRLFYPLSVVDSTRLEAYWCIDITESIPRQTLGEQLAWDSTASFAKEISVFPKAIESAVKKLALYDWQRLLDDGPYPNSQDTWELPIGWCRFEIPCVLVLSDDLLSAPHYAPQVPEIDQEPKSVGEPGSDEVVWEPAYLSLSEDEAARFTAFIRRLNDVLSRLITHPEWLFIDIALGFLVKAFFSEGLQQLLWHISTLEALVGEKKEGLTDLLGRRVGCVIGKTKKERAKIQKRFKKLYDFRSDLVHGNRELLKEDRIHFGHLREARRIARESLVWFLKCLDQIEGRFTEDPCVAGLPEREDVLASLDMKSDRRAKVQWLLGKLPEEFPHVPEWDDSSII